MVISDFYKSKKKNYYIIVVNNKEYLIHEDVVVEYRLVKGKDISDAILKKALKSNDINEYYNSALSYAIKYNKTEKEVYNYLINKNLDDKNAKDIIKKLVDNKIINDKEICKSLINHYIKQCGIKLIELKLKEHFIPYEIIKEELNNINYDDYYKYLEIIYNKNKDKYNKYDDYTRINKIKAYLLNKGYTYDDISSLNIK